MVITNYQSIDRANIFSLANQPPPLVTPYNLNHHIAELSLARIQYIAQVANLLLQLLSMSNKIALAASQSKPKKLRIFCFSKYSVWFIVYELPRITGIF